MQHLPSPYNFNLQPRKFLYSLDKNAFYATMIAI